MDIRELIVSYRGLPMWLQVVIPFSVFALICLVGGLIQGG